MCASACEASGRDCSALYGLICLHTALARVLCVWRITTASTHICIGRNVLVVVTQVDILAIFSVYLDMSMNSQNLQEPSYVI